MSFTSGPFQGPLSTGDAEALAILRGHFTTAGFNEIEIRRVLQGDLESALTLSMKPLLVRRLPEGGLLPTLIRLFLMGTTMDPKAVDRELAPLTADRLSRLGLLRPVAGGVESTVTMAPFDGLFLACDKYVADSSALPPDYVIGVNPTTVSLAAITIRRPAKRALDLGAGAGALALLAARHCERVVGTDINARALNFAEFNAALNGVANVEFRLGSLFEPVEGESFDLIVSNPPYVISPESGLQFRDSGAPDDSFCRTVVTGMPSRLTPGGFGVVRFSWALRGDERGAEPVKRWVEGRECDALILHIQTDTPLNYAGVWNRPLLVHNPAEFATRLDQWTAHFERRGITAIATGAVILRRRPGAPNWVRAETLNLHGDPGAGRQLERMFEAQDWIQGPEGAGTAVFGPARDLVIDHEAAWGEGGFGIRENRFRFAGGLGLRVDVDAPTMRVLTCCDGKRTLGEILVQLAPGEEPEAVDSRRRIANNVVRLYSLGFLARIDANSGAGPS